MIPISAFFAKNALISAKTIRVLKADKSIKEKIVLRVEKCEKLGKKYALPGIDFPSKEMTEEWIRMISSYTTITVKRS